MASERRKLPSELRFDPVSQGWILIATGRALRPESFKEGKPSRPRSPKKGCPFETMSLQDAPVAAFLKGKKIDLRNNPRPARWTTLSLPNKYPAFAAGDSLNVRTLGPYQAMDGVGFHEVIVTKDHTKDIPDFSFSQMEEVIEMYQERYLDLMNEEFSNYISIFKNRGPRAGASIAHPHSQIVGAPITDPVIRSSLAGSLNFWNAHTQCVHCTMLVFDFKEKKRIVFENECVVAVCPYASRIAFEVRIYPKKHLAYFERSETCEKRCLAEAFVVVMKKLKYALNNPDYNYFLHTSPADGKNYDHYHWHWEILPKTSTWAGFEIGTGIEISSIEPERAAEFLQKH